MAIGCLILFVACIIYTENLYKEVLPRIILAFLSPFILLPVSFIISLFVFFILVTVFDTFGLEYPESRLFNEILIATLFLLSAIICFFGLRYYSKRAVGATWVNWYELEEEDELDSDDDWNQEYLHKDW